VAGPLVTVIVASLNGSSFVRDALESLFAQSYEPFEVVFVDDGSTDDTARIAQSFPVRYVYQGQRGLPAARNTGLAIAEGELVAFLDDDDLLPPTKLALQARYLVDHPEVGCVLGRQDWILDEDTDLSGLRRDPVFGDLGGVPMGSAMIRTHVLRELGGFDETYAYAEDRDLFVRLREHGVLITVLPEIVLHRRLHGSNMTLSPPASHPLLRSLRSKVARTRGASDDR
jgi:glycosyltransferase involved in cell wall biosynthesis